MNQLEQIAKTCHSVHLAYSKEAGIEVTQPIWEEVSLEHKQVIMNSVKKILSGEIKSKIESHNNFVNEKLANGWEYGNPYSKTSKLNPRLVPYQQLSKEDKMKETLFFETVNSFL